MESLHQFIFDSLKDVFSKKEFEIKAVNFSSYGASFVYIGEDGKPVAPLYNYLKPYPQKLSRQFYNNYGGKEKFSLQTASPVLGSLNSGMQLYRLKYEKPGLFQNIKYALHLPQYLSYLLSGTACSDITSIGCHTGLWNFTKNYYHEWLSKEHILKKLAPLVPSNKVINTVFHGNSIAVGAGLHDTSATLIPYLLNFPEPFVLISTGTWCISLNPFNHLPLTINELKNDCLCYMQYQGKPIKASRIFAGQEHEQQVKRIASHFNENPVRYKNIKFDPSIIAELKKKNDPRISGQCNSPIKQSVFEQRDLVQFASGEVAYHQLILDIVALQCGSTKLVLEETPVKQIFVDGGFGKNGVYLNLLAAAFYKMEVYAASMVEGTAIGAAMCIHHS